MKVTQSCPTFCDSVDCSPPVSSVHGILWVGILEWVAIPFSRGSSQSKDRTPVSSTAGRLYHLSHHSVEYMKHLVTLLHTLS